MPIINQAIPGAQVRPNPGLQIAEPELQLVPNDRRITAAGLDRAAVANIVRALTSGAFVGEYFDGNDRMDMILKGPTWTSPEQLASTPVATPLAGLQALGELTDIQRTVGPTQLLRVNGQRTLTLSVTPPADMTVQEALQSLRETAGPQIREILPADVTLAYRGTADRLDAAFSSMAVNLATAAVVLLLSSSTTAASVPSLDPALVILSFCNRYEGLLSTRARLRRLGSPNMIGVWALLKILLLPSQLCDIVNVSYYLHVVEYY